MSDFNTYINIYNNGSGTYNNNETGMLNGGKLYEIKTVIPINQGSYTWTVPSNFPIATNYRIRMQTQVYDGGYYDDISDANFTIAAATKQILKVPERRLILIGYHPRAE